jgi:hypothetical protein
MYLLQMSAEHTGGSRAHHRAHRFARRQGRRRAAAATATVALHGRNTGSPVVRRRAIAPLGAFSRCLRVRIGHRIRGTADRRGDRAERSNGQDSLRTHLQEAGGPRSGVGGRRGATPRTHPLAVELLAGQVAKSIAAEGGMCHRPVGRLRTSQRSPILHIVVCGKAIGHRQSVSSATSSHQVAPGQLKLECHRQRGAGGRSE